MRSCAASLAITTMTTQAYAQHCKQNVWSFVKAKNPGFVRPSSRFGHGGWSILWVVMLVAE